MRSLYCSLGCAATTTSSMSNTRELSAKRPLPDDVILLSFALVPITLLFLKAFFSVVLFKEALFAEALLATASFSATLLAAASFSEALLAATSFSATLLAATSFSATMLAAASFSATMLSVIPFSVIFVPIISSMPLLPVTPQFVAAKAALGARAISKRAAIVSFVFFISAAKLHIIPHPHNPIML